LPLEIVGFTLTFIDVFLSKTNTALERKFQQLLISIDQLWKRKNDLLAGIYFSLLLLSGFGMLLSSFWKSDVADLITFLSFISWIINAACLIIFQVLIRLLPERKLVAFGLTLSLMGILGEIYQVSQINF
jgi:hypothetical protein